LDERIVVEIVQQGLSDNALANGASSTTRPTPGNYGLSLWSDIMGEVFYRRNNILSLDDAKKGAESVLGAIERKQIPYPFKASVIDKWLSDARLCRLLSDTA